MNVHIAEWGSGVSSTYTDANTGDPGLFKYLASQSGTTTDIGGVLAQYMDNTDVNSQNRFAYGGMVQLTPPTSGSANGCALPSCVDDSFIQSALQNAISAKTLPAPTSNGLQTMYVVLFPPNVNVCQGGVCAYASNGFCAYHGSFQLASSGPQVLYAAMVDNAGYSGCGSSSSDLANQTDVLSHEVAETINDPLVAEATTNGPPLGWYDTNQHDPNGGGEIGDICVGTTEQALNGTWTVQKLWSNLDSNCVAGESAYSAPSAAFLVNSAGTTGQAVSFDASGSSDPSADHTAISGTSYSISSGISNYAWDWGDGTTSAPSSTPSASHTYANAGNYQVSLTVTDHLGFTSTVTHQVSITAPPPPPNPPVVTTGAASGVDYQSATLNGTINPENQSVQCKFVYGTSSTNLNQSTPCTSTPTGQTTSPVTATLSGLSASTTYYYELEAVSGGQTYTDNPPAAQHFTTSAAPQPSPNPAPGVTPSPQTPPSPAPANPAPLPPPPPGVTTGSASHVSSSAATVSGSVNPNGSATTYQVQFGPSTAYGYSSAPVSAGSGNANLPVSVTLGGLKPRTTYHYRLVASTAHTTVVGGDQTFTTARALARAPRFSFRILGMPSLPGALRGGINVRFSCSQACVAHFSVLEVPRTGVLRAVGTPLTVASGSGRRRSKGSATARARFSRAMQKRLKPANGLKLTITGLAVGHGTLPSSPAMRKLTLHRRP